MGPRLAGRIRESGHRKRVLARQGGFTPLYSRTGAAIGQIGEGG